MKAQMQFEETARRLDEQERDTRRAACTAVKEFNKNQVGGPGLSGQASPFPSASQVPSARSCCEP